MPCYLSGYTILFILERILIMQRFVSSRFISTCLLAVFLSIFSLNSAAQAIPQFLQKMNFEQWYVGANIGTSMPSISGASTTVLPGVTGLAPQDVANTHKVSGAMAFSLEGGAQFGIRHVNPTRWFNYYRLGLRYQNQMAETLTGQGSWVGFSQMTDAYDYTYNAQSQILLVDGALGLYDWEKISTFLHAGVGMAMTQANNYNETAGSDFPGKASYGFSNKTSSSMVGVLGLGVAMKKNWHAILSYDYFTSVQANLGAGDALEYATPTAPKANLLNQTVSLGLRYQF
jgi:opacity protein-like surface antigen